MNKVCKFCNKPLIAEGKNSWKKLFCDVICQQEYWGNIRNKTGKRTKTSRDLARKNNLILLTGEQLQICLGGMMGDSSIRQRFNGACSLQMCHGEKQLQYLEYKKNSMSEFFLQSSPNKCPEKLNIINDKSFVSSNSYHYTSIQHQTFTDLFGLFYITEKGKKRKRVTMNILNKLQPLSVLIWFLDDGCYFYHQDKHYHQLYLSTQRYSIGEHRTMKKWFWHKWRIETVITPTSNGKYFILRMNKEGRIKFSELFLEPFKDSIPECMHYKFPNF